MFLSYKYNHAIGLITYYNPFRSSPFNATDPVALNVRATMHKPVTPDSTGSEVDEHVERPSKKYKRAQETAEEIRMKVRARAYVCAHVCDIAKYFPSGRS